MYSKFSNCRLENNDSNPFSNVLNVSSKRTASDGGFNVTDCANVNEEQIEELYAKLAEIEESKNDSTDEDFTDNSIAHIAYSIENKVMLTKKFNCSLCKCIFEQNTKITEDIQFKSSEKPCQSTFDICKRTERFMKVDLLNGLIDFSVIYHEILQNLDIDALYGGTDFSDHCDHKIFLIRYVVDEFVRINGTYLAKIATSNEHKKHLRVSLHKLLHYLGQ